MSLFPIQDICIVSEKTSCPQNYEVIARTSDSSEDADLWRDGLFARKVTRYLCFSKNLANSPRVLVDLAIVSDRDPVPAGYTVIDYTSDTRERALKKQLLCAQYALRTDTDLAIGSIALLGRTKRPAVGYTLVGELNSLALCIRQCEVAHEAKAVNNHQPQVEKVVPVQHNETNDSHFHGLGLTGIPFHFHPSLTNSSKTTAFQLPPMQFKTIEDINRDYPYNPTTEKAALQRTISMQS